MSIQTEITRIAGNVANAYSALSDKGATMPSEQNTNNLESTIRSLEMVAAEAMSIETIRAICYVPSVFETKYTELEYIESGGSQYIDTGFTPNQDTRVVMVAELKLDGTNDFLFGARTGSTSNTYGFNAYNTKYRSHYNTKYADFDTSVSYSEKFTVDKNKNVTTLNGEHTLTATYAAFAAPCSMTIFACNQEGSMKNLAIAKVYSCQIYDNDALVRDFIPCYRKADGAYGLYDKVTTHFYPDAAGGNFTGA